MIDIANSVIAGEIRSCYLKYLEKLHVKEQMTVSVNHFGMFSQDLINSIALSVEDLMVSFGDDKKTIKRIFSILIEGLQNIRLHAERDEFDRPLAFLFFCKDPEIYKIVFGNIIQNADIELVESYLDKINDLDDAALRELYLGILSKGYLSKKGGAGLGFITMRMKSGNPLNYSIVSLDEDRSLFTVEVILNRSK
jgi:hypothetical protein